MFTGIENYVCAGLAGNGFQALMTSAREDKSKRLACLKERGFVFLMRYPISKLKVADFDFGLHEGRLEEI